MLARMEVELLDVMGSDLTVVNAARVSMAKQSDWKERATVECADCLGAGCDWCGGTGEVTIQELKDNDRRLISYLAEHKHWSPFAHPQLSFRIKAPIAIARQLGKHQVGLTWNEVSRRYVDTPPEFYLPEIFRQRAENVKQGSAPDPVENNESLKHEVANFLAVVENYYSQMIDMGVCPEQARFILPQCMMTEWIWTGSLYAFARVVALRLDDHAQAECREIAGALAEECARNFPASWVAIQTNA